MLHSSALPSLGWLQTLSDYAPWQEECRVYISREVGRTTNEISVVKSADGRSRESSRVRSILKKIDRRVHLIYCSDLLAKVACTTLGISLFFQINGILFPVESPPLRVLIVGSMLFYICFAIKPIFEKNRLNRTAGLTDELADLSDEIKTAYWFVRNPMESAWIDLQLRRAAKSLDKLKLEELFPFKVSRWFGGVFILGGLGTGLSLIPNETPLFLREMDPETSFSEIENQIADLQSSLEGDVGTFLDESDFESLERVLEDLKGDEILNEELLMELQQAEEILNEEIFGMDALTQELVQLSQEFSESQKLSDFANSLGEMDLTSAAQKLREMSENLANMDPSVLNELEQELQSQEFSESFSAEELLDALDEAGTALAQDQISKAEGSLTEAAEALDAMAQNQSLDEALNEASMSMQALSQEISQRANNSSMTPDGQMESGAAGSASDEVTKSSGGDPGDGSGPAGNSTGTPSEVAELELGEATTLEVQLSLEIIDEQFMEEYPDPQNLFQGASQKQLSDLQFYEIGGLTEYSNASALDVETVFWQYSDLVKNYFLGIRPLRKNDNKN